MIDHHHALPSGHCLDEYRIEHVLGSGGFGITYYARDTHLDKPVAVKEYLPNEFALRTDSVTVQPKSTGDRGDYQWGLARFLEEAQTLARFDHPHLNKVHRFFEANGTAYMVLEYIEGETLAQVLRREGYLDAVRLRRLLDELLSGLEEVHAAGFVHRDIKPANIIFREDGSAVLLDFGAARQDVGRRSRSITSILTPGYAPVEQYAQQAEDVGPWTDIYSLGMVAYRCISGISDGGLLDGVNRARLYFKGELDKDLPSAVDVGSGRYPGSVLSAVDWSIKADEGERPQSAALLRDALDGGAVGASDGAGKAPARQAVKHAASKRSPGAAGVGQESGVPGSGGGMRKWVLAAVLLAVFAAGAAGWPLFQEMIYWRGISCASEDEAGLYLKRYPDGYYAAEADACLSEARRKREEAEARLAAAEEKRKQEEEAARLAAEEKRKQEEEAARLAAEEKRKQAEEAARLAAEEKRKQEEEAARLAAEEKRKQEEAARQAAEAERKQEEEAARQAEEKRKQEEAARQAEEKRKQEEEAARQAEEKRKQEEAARQAEEKRKQEEAARQAEEKRKREEAARQAEVDRFRRVVGRDPYPHAIDANGWTDLHYAAAMNSPELAEMLLAAGAPVDVRLKDDGKPFTDVLKKNLRELTGISFNWGRYGLTPLHLAAYGNALETAKQLAEKGADVNEKDSIGSTPLHHAAWGNALETAKWLAEKGADVDAKNSDGETPLHHAAWGNAWETAKWLAEKGADVDEKDNSGWTPLHYAAWVNALETAKWLAEKGADVDAKDSNGETPLHYAAWVNALETAKWLVGKGADVNARNNGGKTPRDAAVRKGHDEMARLLAP